MPLSSPTGQTVSVLRTTSFLRGCDPIEESKQELGSLRGIYCASMGEPVRDQDWKSRQPRTYHSDNSSFYPPIYSNPHSPFSRSNMPVNSRSPSREHGSDVKREELSPLHRKRESSWTRNGTEGNSHRDSIEETKDVRMRPMSFSAMPNGERLPGIAHLDEQMHTPWSAGHARRTAGLRGTNGDDSLRRLSSQSFTHSGRSWRSSLPDSDSPGSRSELPSTFSAHTIRRASSPSHVRFEHRSSFHSHYPELPSQSPGESRRSPFDNEPIASYRQKVNEESEDLNRLPLREDRRHQATFTSSFDSRDEPYSYSQDRRMGRASDFSQYRHSKQPLQQRDAEMTSSYSHQSSHEQGYGHRILDRDSPSSYLEESSSGGGQHRLSEGGNHSYPSSGINTSPSVPRRRGKLPKVVTDLLKAWLLDHASHPYPTEDEKRRLCSVTGLSISQVSNWFINARRRILVPQGSGNFALGQASGTGVSVHPPSPPPLHHLAPPSLHHQNYHRQHQNAPPFQEEGKHAVYRTINSASRSHSPDTLPPLSRRSFDESR